MEFNRRKLLFIPVSLFRSTVVSLFIFQISFAGAQNSRTDSLIAEAYHGKTDSARVKSLAELILLHPGETDTVLKLGSTAEALAKKSNYIKGLAIIYKNIGWNYFLVGDYKNALTQYDYSLEYWKKLYPPSGGYGKAGILINIGLIFDNLGKYPEALQSYLESLKESEKTGSVRLQCMSYGNIAILYSKEKNYKTALDYYAKALDLAEKMGDKKGMAALKGNIANVLFSTGDFEKAAEYYSASLNFAEQTGDKAEIAKNLTNLATIYKTRLKTDEAMAANQKALKLYTETGDPIGQANNLLNIGLLHLDKKQISAARLFLNKAVFISDSIYYPEVTVVAEQYLTKMDSAVSDFGGALTHYKRFIAARDSLGNEEEIKKQTQIEMQFDFDKKQAADSVRVAEEKKVAAAELRAEKNKAYSLYGGLCLLMIFAGFIFNRYRVTRKQKSVIEEQKKLVDEQKFLVEEKNKDILDSIHYAERIQRSLMPSEKYILTKMKDLR